MDLLNAMRNFTAVVDARSFFQAGDPAARQHRHHQRVVRLAPHLMAGARRSGRERGKSDPIDALAIARAALREGVETLPTARLAGAEL